MTDANSDPKLHARADAGRMAAADGGNAGEAPAGCPVHVSVETRRYGSGDESDDDYSPRNVGAIWVTGGEGEFLRTIALWGPGYLEFAYTWAEQSRGSRVDVVAAATRSDHSKRVEASWDCRDRDRAWLAEGQYAINIEFSEAERQGPLLSGATALKFGIGAAVSGARREARGSFGAITIEPAP